MTRVCAEPASKPRRRRAQGQLRARQGGCRSESASPGVRRLPIGLAPAEVMFDGIKILTAPGLVMTPVPTTEALVQWAAEWIGSRSVRVTDVGTGSGAVAVALARRAPAARIWATDDSEPAVALARSSGEYESLRLVRHAASPLVQLDVIGKLVTLSEREAEALREVAAADAGRSTSRRDLSLLLERGLRTKTTVALSRAEARELADLLATGAFGSNLALLQEALLLALEASPP
jgi:predicted O-methyltransferase YrrM